MKILQLIEVSNASALRVKKLISYKTTDGQMFLDEFEAVKHQFLLDSKNEEIKGDLEEKLLYKKLVRDFISECCEKTHDHWDRISTNDLYKYFLEYLSEKKIGQELRTSQHTFTSIAKNIYDKDFKKLLRVRRNLIYKNGVADCYTNIIITKPPIKDRL